jgi:hypothetical protein
MPVNFDISKIITLDVGIFFAMLVILMVSRYLLSSDIEKKEHGNGNSSRKQDWVMYTGILIISLIYISSLFFQIEILTKVVQFSFSLLTVYILSLVIQRKILILYGQEVEVS